MSVTQRSAIDANVDRVLGAIEGKVYLPAFGYFTVADWKKLNLPEWQEVFDVELGWDITDFGSNDFARTGCVLFTFRNGSIAPVLRNIYTNPYAEKMLYVGQDQELPLHFHRFKMEDIINRGGGDLIIEAYQSTPDEDLDKKTPLHVVIDGQKRVFKPGERICLKPGSGIRVMPFMYHRFWGEKHDVICWEVSRTNDDHTDNRFLKPGDRFNTVEEDVPARYCLSNEYEKVLGVRKTN